MLKLIIFVCFLYAFINNVETKSIQNFEKNDQKQIKIKNTKFTCPKYFKINNYIIFFNLILVLF